MAPRNTLLMKPTENTYNIELILAFWLFLALSHGPSSSLSIVIFYRVSLFWTFHIEAKISQKSWCILAPPHFHAAK